MHYYRQLDDANFWCNIISGDKGNFTLNALVNIQNSCIWVEESSGIILEKSLQLHMYLFFVVFGLGTPIMLNRYSWVDFKQDRAASHTIHQDIELLHIMMIETDYLSFAI